MSLRLVDVRFHVVRLPCGQHRVVGAQSLYEHLRE